MNSLKTGNIGGPGSVMISDDLQQT
jgi:hypothetical protein